MSNSRLVTQGSTTYMTLPPGLPAPWLDVKSVRATITAADLAALPADGSALTLPALPLQLPARARFAGCLVDVTEQFALAASGISVQEGLSDLGGNSTSFAIFADLTSVGVGVSETEARDNPYLGASMFGSTIAFAFSRTTPGSAPVTAGSMTITYYYYEVPAP